MTIMTIRRGMIGMFMASGATAALTIVLHLSLPFPLERLEAWPRSPELLDRHGERIAERLASDDQRRLPVPLQAISPWLREATIAVEDARFREHLGVDPLAVARATFQNATALRTVSGASTLTMQICRMLDDRPRSVQAKLIESARALQLEGLWDKDRILEAYLNLAPYGGNLRGAEAAARRWFGKSAAALELHEAALLAGLPQSPARLRPDRHQGRARVRRSTVLRRLHELGTITEEQRRRAEALPLGLRTTGPEAGPAPHLADWAWRLRPGGGRLCLDAAVQHAAASLLAERRRGWPRGSHGAVVVIDVASGGILTLIGSADHADPRSGQVNVALAWRSPGSALKPFIFGAAFARGLWTPETVVDDGPLRRAGWNPANFDRDCRGLLLADEALRASRNLPAIRAVEALGQRVAAAACEAAGVRLRAGAADRAGLALAVGAVECRLVDLTNAYATLARFGRYRPWRVFQDESSAESSVLPEPVANALAHILEVSGDFPYACKTGTSSGRRDAWALGFNRRCAIGVWVGRMAGGSRIEYVGAQIAQPLLHDLFQMPALRDARGYPAPAWLSRPEARPVSPSTIVRIVHPEPGARFYAPEGRLPLHPRIEGQAEHLFLNGRWLPPTERAALDLGPGRYELRCVFAEGRVAASRFTVHVPEAAGESGPGPGP